MLALAPGAVHLWLAHYDRIDAAAELEDCLRLLSTPEKAQMHRFVFERDRRRFLVTRALVRRTLSRYVPVAACDWQFEKNDHGRPGIAAAHALAPPLSFNVSHTHSLIALVVAAGCAVGVDVENAADRDAPLDVASSYFSAREAGALAALPRGEQPRRFFEYWTLKESYIKARGLGLAIPLEQFGFEFPSPRELELHAHAALGDDAGRWLFWQLRVADHYLLAVCVERTRDAPPRLVCHPARPHAAGDAGPRLWRASADLLALPAHGVESVGTA